MKKTLYTFIAASSIVSAGPDMSPIAEELDWLEFSLEARARIEQRNQQELDNSYAGTLSLRPGMELKHPSGLSAFIQSEHTLPFLSDYQTGTPQSSRFTPYVAGNTPIADPRSHELNQLNLNYLKDSLTLRAGRQRLNLDNSAHIGNVGWRQNEQTLDAALARFSNSSYTLQYAYANRVNRIFGSDAFGAVGALKGDVHLLNGSVNLGENSLHGYAYLMDFSEQSFARASNNTLGAFTKINIPQGQYHLELAAQTETSGQPDYSALYFHTNYTNKIGDYSVTFGAEYLEQDYVTPLATVHAFNGFGDVFINDRLGLTAGPTQWNGLSDIYTTVGTTAPLDIQVSTTAHAFFDDKLHDFYGWELDAVGTKVITPNTKALAKFAYFFGHDSSQFNSDVAQFSLQLDYTF